MNLDAPQPLQIPYSPTWLMPCPECGELCDLHIDSGEYGAGPDVYSVDCVMCEESYEVAPAELRAAGILP